jgi:hypothetical protein
MVEAADQLLTDYLSHCLSFLHDRVGNFASRNPLAAVPKPTIGDNLGPAATRSFGHGVGCDDSPGTHCFRRRENGVHRPSGPARLHQHRLDYVR